MRLPYTGGFSLTYDDLGTYAENWDPVTLRDLVSLVRGRSYRRADLQDNPETALVTLKSFHRGGGYRADGLKPYVGKYNAEQIISPGEMVVSQTDITQNADVIGRPAIVLGQSRYEKLVASLDCAIVRVTDRERLDPKFLYYRMMAQDYTHHVKSYSTGTTVLHLAKDALPSFEFVLPSLPEQRRIADILGALDDKIELNRQMNETAEQMAHAMFQDWFVDFGPVCAKMNGHEPYLPPEVWELFPDRLVDSELGGIPEGWEVKSLDEIADYRNGLALQRFRPEENEERLPVVKIAQLRIGTADGSEWAKSSITPNCIIDDGDVVFSWSGSLLVRVWCGGRAALNQHLFKVTSTQYPKWFFLHCTESHLPAFQAIAAGKTTTMGHIKREHLKEAKCAVPGRALLSAVDGILGGLLSRIVSANIESREAAMFRDNLLPRLLSGELRPSELESVHC